MSVDLLAEMMTGAAASMLSPLSVVIFTLSMDGPAFIGMQTFSLKLYNLRFMSALLCIEIKCVRLVITF